MESKRILNFKLFYISIVMMIIGRLFYIQVIEEKYKKLSLNNSVRSQILYPSRGDITGRDGELLAQSKESYDIFVTPRELGVFDTTALCDALELPKLKFDSVLDACKRYSTRKASVIKERVSQISKLQIEELRINGITAQYRSVRHYPSNIGGNILGYVSNVTARNIELDTYYDMHDYVGKMGIEKVYELDLRGVKGKNLYAVNVHGAVMSEHKDGEENFSAVSGEKLTTSIDLELQKLGEELMIDKIGAIVAIEPSTGEILAMISSPTYSPDLFVGSDRTANFKSLFSDNRQPMHNRATSATYPAGSIFKVALGLTLLQNDIITPQTEFKCYEGYKSNYINVGCHYHKPIIDLSYAIKTSCNSYFCHGFMGLLKSPKFGSSAKAIDAWAQGVREFGFGSKLGTDVISESGGLVPNSELYDGQYGKNRWSGYTIISLAIGQGEILTTPLQLANFGAIIANRGFYYIPHFVKRIGENGNINQDFKTKISTQIEKKHYETVIDAMWLMVNEKEKGLQFKVDGLDICGKTSTVQNQFGEDHSAFLGFAPKDSPKIVVNVYVENGGFGSSIAAPIASLMIEKYITGEIKNMALLKYVLDKKIEYPYYDKK